MSERERDAFTLVKYEQIEERLFRMRTEGRYDENALSELEPQVNELWTTRVHNSLNASLLEKDAETMKNLINSMVQCDAQSASMVLDEFDYEQLEKQIAAKIAAQGLAPFLKTTYSKMESSNVLVASVSRHFSTPQVKERAPAVRAHREQGPAKETVAFDEGQQQNLEVQAIRNVKIALKEYYLRTKKPIALYKFTFNKHSFSQTIENLFYTSFLVRDSAVAIFIENDMAMIRPLFIRRADYVPGENEAEVDPNVVDSVQGLKDSDFRLGVESKFNRHQFVSDMSFSLWQQLKGVFAHEPIIPSRRDSDECPYTG